MAFLGLRGTGSFGTDERPKSFRELILWENPNGQAPLTALMAKMGSEKLSDPEFNWWQERMQQVRVQVNGALTNVATALVVDAEDGTHPFDGKSIRVGDILMVEDATGLTTTERVLVTANAGNGTGLTITRGFAGSAAAAIGDNAWLIRIGTAFGEGSNPADTYSANPTKMNNLAQIFKTTYKVTNTAKETTFRTGDPVKNEKKRKMFTHSVDMELAYIFGTKSETTDGAGMPLRTTNGIVAQLATNKRVYSGVNTGATGFSADKHLDHLEAMFDYDAGGAGNERLGFVGNGYIMELRKAIEAKANSRVNFEGSVKVYGVELQKLVTPGGTFYFKTHPLFNTHPVHKYSALYINPKGILDRWLRKTKFEDNIQPPGADYTMGQWLTESGPEVHFEGSHAFFSNCIYVP